LIAALPRAAAAAALAKPQPGARIAAHQHGLPALAAKAPPYAPRPIAAFGFSRRRLSGGCPRRSPGDTPPG